MNYSFKSLMILGLFIWSGYLISMEKAEGDSIDLAAEEQVSLSLKKLENFLKRKSFELFEEGMREKVMYLVINNISIDNSQIIHHFFVGYNQVIEALQSAQKNNEILKTYLQLNKDRLSISLLVIQEIEEYEPFGQFFSLHKDVAQILRKYPECLFFFLASFLCNISDKPLAELKEHESEIFASYLQVYDNTTDDSIDHEELEFISEMLDQLKKHAIRISGTNEQALIEGTSEKEKAQGSKLKVLLKVLAPYSGAFVAGLIITTITAILLKNQESVITTLKLEHLIKELELQQQIVHLGDRLILEQFKELLSRSNT